MPLTQRCRDSQRNAFGFTQAELVEAGFDKLSLRGHSELGSTFIGVLERYAQALHAHGNTLMLVSVSPGGYEQLTETEFLTVVGAEHVFVASTPGESTLRAYQKAQELIQAAPAQSKETDKPR